MSTPGPGQDPDDVDARFREIVAGLDLDVPGPRVQVPNVHPTAWRFHEPPEEDEEHFVPPPPPPLPAGDLHFWAILVGLLGGPLLVLLSAVLPVLSSSWAAVGALLTVTGFVLLVLRAPRHRHDDDAGAQV